MLKHLLNQILKIPLKLIFRGKTLFFINGMRRSGNHAFVKWFVNALEERSTKLIMDEQFYNFHYTDSGKTVFLNEVNAMKSGEYLHMIINNRTKIRQSNYVIISGEDCYANYRSFKIPRFDKAIYVKRSLLNLIASRIKVLLENAKNGKRLSWAIVDDYFFEKLLTFQKNNLYKAWEFEKWVTSEQYRSEFLNLFDLSIDIMPTISSKGGGSSFTGTSKTPESSELLNRYKEIEFSETILEYLKNDRYQKLLNETELQYLDKKYF